MHQSRQYVILTLVLLGCAACVFFGIKQMVSDPYSDAANFDVAKWSRVDVPLYEGPATYSAASSRGGTVSLPMVSSKSRSLFHHNASVSYNGEGSVTARASVVHPSYQTVYQTSNSTVHSVGSGGGLGVGYNESSAYGSQTVSGGNGGFNVPNVGISTPSVPTETYNARMYAYNTIGVSRGNLAQAPIVADVASASSSSRTAMPGIRRAQPGYDGDEDGELSDDGDWMWDREQEKWVSTHEVGNRKVVNGQVWEWNGTEWVFVPDQAGPNAPIGDLPWMLFLMMLAGYAVCRRMKTKKITIKK